MKTRDYGLDEREMNKHIGYEKNFVEGKTEKTAGTAMEKDNKQRLRQLRNSCTM